MRLDFSQAVAELERRGNLLEYEVRRAEADSLQHAHELAVIHSSGPIPQAQLTQEGHPFARRHGSPRRDPSVINVQSGAFVGAWQASGPQGQGGHLTGTVENTDPKAEFLDKGTRYMFARPLPERVIAENTPFRLARLEQAVKDALG